MRVILVCRMGSSRLPGKTLRPFGEVSLLAHIIRRIQVASIPSEDIIVCTSALADDQPVINAAEALGCRSFGGSPHNVSDRILSAAAAHAAEQFLLVLGDNPWIDPGQIAEVAALGSSGNFDYIVTATPELPRPWPEKMYPTGTRLQCINREFMVQRLSEIATPEAEEHTSKLFANLPPNSRAITLSPSDGWNPVEIANLNISINTQEDYKRALAALNRVGPAASAHAVTQAILANEC